MPGAPPAGLLTPLVPVSWDIGTVFAGPCEFYRTVSVAVA
jgi:hypothetical protein